MRHLFSIKPLHKLQQESISDAHGLKRALSATNLTTLGIGAIIGAGIFVLSGKVAAQNAGPAIILSLLLSGSACAFAGLCYAEFASLLPISGSAYTYAYATLGEFLAWIIGWDLILEYLFAASTVAVGWSGYVVSFFRDLGVVIPQQLTAPTFCSFSHPAAQINLPAMVVVAFVTILLVLGIKGSALFNNIMVFVKVSAIIVFVGIGFAFVSVHNWHPFIPHNTGEFGRFGWSGIIRGAGIIFFAYIGFDAVSTAAQEARNPQRDMPIGIMGSLAICTVLFVLVAIVLTGVVSYTQLNVPDPIAVGVNAMGASMFWLRPIIKVAIIAGLSSVVLVLLLGQPRIFFSMANDGLLPSCFAKVHPKFRTPHFSQIFTGIVAVVLAGMLPISTLGELVSIGTLLAFVIVCASVIVLRKTRPDLDRPFKTPLVPLIPILGICFCVLQMVFLAGDTWLRLIIWMAAGFFVYFLYGRKHSKVRKDLRQTAARAASLSEN
jgi:basic amino acid/polyamine antiporter, APA family